MSKKEHNAIEIVADENNADDAVARTYTDPVTLACLSIKGHFHSDDKMNINALVSELDKQCKALSEGDLSRLENMLLSQAHSLDGLFYQLTANSRLNMGEYLNAAEKYMRLALKAQSQCRATIETLAEMKNPKPYIQNNRAHYQQVNNSVCSDAGMFTLGKNNLRNELLEDHSDEWLDTGAPQETSGKDKAMETVGT